MRVLVIHPEDDLQGEPWVSQRWDRVIDLGRAGAESYARATERLGCPISPLSEFRESFDEMRRVRELLALGMGKLMDDFGLDWWELTAILVHQQLEIAYLLGRVVERLGASDEVHVSRPCFQADVLRLRLGPRLQVFPPSPDLRRGSARHYLQLLKKFPLPQLFEFFWDKYDPSYQMRGVFNVKRRAMSEAVVLMPSNYGNVSRTAAAYAEILPGIRFLLVLTRRSGRLEQAPANVTTAWLRRYASVRAPSRRREVSDLLQRWNRLQDELKSVPEIQTLEQLGCFGEFPDRFARGVEIRDAWRNVLDSEPVQAVICADDSNPYTHIPLLLAKERGLPAIACHHGALDGRYMFKRSHADVLLAKGKMEEDYLVRLCGIPPEIVRIGAPALPAVLGSKTSDPKKTSIVFFSEAYEVGGGRGQSYYQDVLPALADLAISHQRELVIKLHPSESLSERTRFIEQTLSPAQRQVTRVVSGPLGSDLLGRAWFAVTVMSTVVVECTLREVPCFLCAWLEAWPYGYDDQFDRFDLGIRLKAREEIPQIPAVLESQARSPSPRENCWLPIDAERLRTLLAVGRASSTANRSIAQNTQ